MWVSLHTSAAADGFNDAVVCSLGIALDCLGKRDSLQPVYMKLHNCTARHNRKPLWPFLPRSRFEVRFLNTGLAAALYGCIKLIAVEN